MEVGGKVKESGRKGRSGPRHTFANPALVVGRPADSWRLAQRWDDVGRHCRWPVNVEYRCRPMC